MNDGLQADNKKFVGLCGYFMATHIQTSEFLLKVRFVRQLFVPFSTFFLELYSGVPFRILFTLPDIQNLSFLRITLVCPSIWQYDELKQIRITCLQRFHDHLPILIENIICVSGTQLNINDLYRGKPKQLLYLKFEKTSNFTIRFLEFKMKFKVNRKTAE